MAESAQPFVVGGCSAILASSCIHPIDLSKVRMQLYATTNPGKPVPGAFAIISGMIQRDGITSVYAGLSASIMRQAVYGTARIGLHRTFSDMLIKRNGGQPLDFGTKILGGMASGGIAVTIGTPFDVALVRMQADSMKAEKDRKGYKNVFDAIGKIFRDEGITGLYSGLAPNILRGMAMNVGQLACYDQAKEILAAFFGEDPTVSIPSLKVRLLSACVAGLTATTFSLPFDLMKSRLQDAGKYKGLIDCARQTLTKEGPLAFWTGFGAYYLRSAPHAMIILMSTDPIKAQYRALFGLHE
jgi:solute carrier family 25 (mitochondrial oxoglutarate transporter), member 11